MINNTIFSRYDKADHFFKACGSFGQITGNVVHSNDEIINETDTYRMVCRYKKNDYGVYSRKDTFENLSDKPITVNSLKSVFVFDGGEYEAYTQYNSSIKESMGMWHDLSTGVCINGRSARTSIDATPFLALWNKQNYHGAAIHLIPSCAWEVKAKLAIQDNQFYRLYIEAGIQEYNFNVVLEPGEKIELPEIIFYGFTKKLDMDCYKLHRYLNEKYPRKYFPAIYNSWLYNFDKISYDMLAEQIPVAAEMGMEYFVIDAGWFGNGENWGDSVGDWEENTTSALCGRMVDIANLAREHGMKFGLWFEPERAAANSDIVKNHPDWFIFENGTHFLDFANADARNRMFEIICSNIDKYGLEFIKFDFNADLFFDPKHNAFLDYHKGHKEFMKMLRNKYPDIYITSCASGGARMNLAGCEHFDSFWPSDNESPYDEMRIYSESILRLPPQMFEKWTCIQSMTNFAPTSVYCPSDERIIACNDSIWRDVRGVTKEHLKGYLSGSPIGFSCNLTAISPKIRDYLTKHIAEVKKSRDFWIKAEARILCKAKDLSAYQYSDKTLSDNRLVIFFGNVMQKQLCVYPVLDKNKKYSINGGEAMSGKNIMENGITVNVPQLNESITVEVKTIS